MQIKYNSLSLIYSTSLTPAYWVQSEWKCKYLLQMQVFTPHSIIQDASCSIYLFLLLISILKVWKWLCYSYIWRSTQFSDLYHLVWSCRQQLSNYHQYFKSTKPAQKKNFSLWTGYNFIHCVGSLNHFLLG